MQVNISEILRYLRVVGPPSQELYQQITAMTQRLEAAIQPRYIYKYFPLLRADNAFRLSGTSIFLTGDTARRMLEQCDGTILLACTLGTQFDSLLRAEQARSMANAIIMDACGNALVESGCDGAEREIAVRFPTRYLTDRFSPGYGDLPLELQPLLCSTLDAQRRIGVHVTDHYLLNPIKSVTAIIGLSNQPQVSRIRGCEYCSMQKTCTLRKGGNRCALE